MRFWGISVFRTGKIVMTALLLGFIIMLTSCPSSDNDEKGAGKATPWPKWVFEHWVWYGESNQADTIQLVADYQSRGIPVGAVVIDSPWETGYNTFKFEPGLYPDPKAMVDWFHQQDVRVLIWMRPVISAVCEDGDTTCPEADLYNEGLSQHFFMGDGKLIPWSKCPSSTPFCGALIDYFNPAAVAWWHRLMDPVLDLGIDGWKCDTIEPFSLLVSVSPYAGPTEPWEFNDRFYEDFFYYTRKRLGRDRVIMARPIEAMDLSAIAGTTLVIAVPNAPREVNFAGWVGDQEPTFPGIQAALLNMYLSAQVGYLSFGSDIGGYNDDPTTKELFIRWAQLGSVCPIMENGGQGEHRPWMIGGDTADRLDTLDTYREFVNLHYKLIPYLHAQAQIAWAQKASLMNLVENADKMYTWEYVLGSDLLVAPMYESGTTRLVAFPPGDNWVYLFNRAQVYTGGTSQSIDFPLDEFPIFLRQGSELEKDLDFP